MYLQNLRCLPDHLLCAGGLLFRRTSMWDMAGLPLSKISYHWKDRTTKLNSKGIIMAVYESLPLNYVKMWRLVDILYPHWAWKLYFVKRSYYLLVWIWGRRNERCCFCNTLHNWKYEIKIKRISENQLKIWSNIKCEILFEYLLWNEYVCFPQIHGLKPKLSMMVFVGFLRSNLVLYMEDTWRELLPW